MNNKKINLPSSGRSNCINSALVAQILSHATFCGVTEIEITAHPEDAAVFRCHFQCIEDHLARNRMIYSIIEDASRTPGTFWLSYNKAGQ